MRLLRSRGKQGLKPGERVLATGSGPDGTASATTHGLSSPDGVVEWHQVESATWDSDNDVLTIIEVADRPSNKRRHRVTLDKPGRLVDVVREQVTASVLVSRHVPVEHSGRGVRVTGRRGPSDEITWSAQVDSGIDMNDPATRARVDDAVALVRGEVE